MVYSTLEANDPAWPKFDIDRDFVPVLDICNLKKFDGSIPRTAFSLLKLYGTILLLW